MNGLTAQLLLAGCGGIVGAGTWLVAIAALSPPAPAPANEATSRRNRRSRPEHVAAGHRALVAAALTGVLAAAVTGWPVAGLLTSAGTLTLPRLLGPDRRHAAEVAQIEAIAGWTEMLRDTLSGAAGLEQAILATQPLTPLPLAAHVRVLAEELRSGQRLRTALDRLADRLADPTADLVIAVLRMAAVGQARDLTTLLGALSSAARDQVALRMRLAAGRARIRTTVRVILGSTLTLAALLVLANRPYLSAYDDAAGQLTLLLVGLLFAAGLAWLDQMSRLQPYPRLWPAQPTPQPPPAPASRDATATSYTDGQR